MGLISQIEFDLKCSKCEVLAKPKTRVVFILNSCGVGAIGGVVAFLFILLLTLIANY